MRGRKKYKFILNFNSSELEKFPHWLEWDTLGKQVQVVINVRLSNIKLPRKRYLVDLGTVEEAGAGKKD